MPLTVDLLLDLSGCWLTCSRERVEFLPAVSFRQQLHLGVDLQSRALSAGNSSLIDWLLDEYIGGANGLGSPNVDFIFLDDEWDATSGPSEVIPITISCLSIKFGLQESSLWFSLWFCGS